MFYPYDPKRLTLQDKEDANSLADELKLTGSDRGLFVSGFYSGIQNRDRQQARRRMIELDECDESLI